MWRKTRSKRLSTVSNETPFLRIDTTENTQNITHMTIKPILTAIVCAAMALTASAKEYKYESVPGDKLGTRIYTLDNGLKVYLSVNKEKPRIQTYIAVRTGSRNDPAETTGLAHYLEHLMFKGTKSFGTSDPVSEAPLLDSIQNRFEQYRHITDPVKRKAFYHEIDSISQLAAQYNIPNEYDKLMSSIGAKGTNAFTNNDVTCYTEDIPSNEVDNWAKIQADRFMNMVLRGFHTELEAVYEEYNISLADDWNKMYYAITAKLFPNHPYGTQTTLGTQEHLKNPSLVNIKNYFNQYYVPNNVAICMSGDFDPDAVIAIIDRYFGAWKKSNTLTYPQFAPVKELTAPTDTTVVGLESESLMMGWKFEGGASTQTDTLEVVAKMLSNGTAGLFDLDVNQSMKCNGVGAFTDIMRDYSALLLTGQPKEGQSLKEVRNIMLEEISKLKSGNFDDALLPSVIANMKLDYYNEMENNEDRASEFVYSFINGRKWSETAGLLDRISKITKRQIVDFANRYLRDNYAVVYKETGTDSTQKKIDKPQITGIPANRDKQSQFVADIIASKPAPIQPRFVDFKRDIQFGKTKKGLPVAYVKNSTNGTFALAYYFEIGEENDKWLPIAAQYFNYIGTDKMSAKQLKQEFYKLACSYSINIDDDHLEFMLTGLDENKAKAMLLFEDFLANAKADKDAYNDYTGILLKQRKDIKLDQTYNFNALSAYAIYGKYNTWRNVPDSTELKSMNPEALIGKIRGLNVYEHSLLYYGPDSEKNVIVLADKLHKTSKKLVPAPKGTPYTEQMTTQNEVFLAPYDAKNIYMTQYHNEGRKWNAEEVPAIAMFNEYFGNGMNAVVFQELRESRALAYAASAHYRYPSRSNGTEYATTFIISQNDKMNDCIRTFNSIIDTIPQSQKAFDLAKQALAKRLASERTTKFGILNAWLGAKRRGIDYSLSEKIYNTLPSITLDDMVRFEKERMANKPYRYIVLGDEKNLDMEVLEKIGPIKRISTDEVFGY